MAGRRLIRAVASVNATRRPEHDVALRALVLAAVLLGASAALLGGTAPVAEALVVIAVLPVAFWWSHRQRHTSNWVVKVAISLLALVVLWRFFDGLAGITSVDDARLPLSRLFLEVQVLHAFDLPQRRDLMFSLASSLALMGLALAAAPPLWMALLLLAYLAVAAAALHRYGLSAATEWAEAGGRAGEVAHVPERVASADQVRAARHRGALAQAVAIALLGGLVFSVLPLRSDTTIGTLPFAFPGDGQPDPADPGRIGSNLPFDGPDDDRRHSDPAQYFGFADTVDPGAVGALDDTPVLRVRTDQPRPLRGVVFDTYRGGRWERGGEQDPVLRQGLPVQLRTSRGPISLREEVTQTIELLQPTPNLLFGASDVAEVWSSARAVSLWSDGTMTTAMDMQPGTIYSVVSHVERSPAEDLRLIGHTGYGVDPAALARWTQLPSDLDPAIADLGARLAAEASAPTPYAVAESVQAWLGANVRYSLDVDPTPTGHDPVAHLLFTTRQGWCEPIASAMVLLLRSQGIPARFVTGFTPGERDLLSGHHVVRASDAHAWVEVFLPHVGWVPMDPTGATTPALDPAGTGPDVLAARLLSRAWQALSQHPGRVVPLLVALFAVAGAGAALPRIRRRLQLRRAGPWARVLHAMRRRGLDTPVSDTPRELEARARRLRPDLDAELLALLRDHEERRRYGGGQAARPEELERAARSLCRQLSRTR